MYLRNINTFAFNNMADPRTTTNNKCCLHVIFVPNTRIPLKKFRSIRRQLTDSGRTSEELLAPKHSLKYNFGFPSSNAPTPETLKNFFDVSFLLLHATAEYLAKTNDLWTLSIVLHVTK